MFQPFVIVAILYLDMYACVMKTVMLIALAVGCSSEASQPQPAPTVATAAPAPSPDRIQLVSKGDPKTARVLRYKLVKGTQSFVELAMAIEAGRPMPKLIQKLEIDVEDVGADGMARVRT